MSPSRKPTATTNSEKYLRTVPAPAAADTAELVAERVAAARRNAGLTLSALAVRTGLSPAYLSQIESASANPTVRTLSQIATALDTEVAALFGSEPGDATSFAPYFSPAARAASVAGMTGVWDRTAAGSRRLVARFVHGDAGDHSVPVCHAGEEFVVVVRGGCRVHVDGITRRLGEGDSCHYDASRPHHLSAATADLTLSVVLSEQGTMDG